MLKRGTASRKVPLLLCPLKEQNTLLRELAACDLNFDLPGTENEEIYSTIDIISDCFAIALKRYW